MGTQLTNDIARIERSLKKTSTLAKTLSPEGMNITRKANHDPVTEADLALNELLHAELVRQDYGWLSEETADDKARLAKRKVWVVDPIDGTREFISGIPEWVVSIGLVDNCKAIGGGILNPLRDELLIGAVEMGVTLNGVTTFVTDPGYLDGAKVLASRSELRDGRWDALKNTSITIIPKGSIAYKLALVAGGMADATISLAPKHEWDIAAGVALVHAAGGKVTDLNGKPIRFNKKNTLMNGVIAAGPNTHGELCKILEEFVDARL